MSTGLSRQAMTNRLNHAMREKVEKRVQEDRRSLMYLIGEFLRQQGLLKTYETLTEEAQLSNNYQICDNIDLEIILKEYNDYYNSRFQKWPQICKRAEIPAMKDSPAATKTSQKDNRAKPKTKKPNEIEESLDENLGLTVTSLSQKDAASLNQDDDEVAKIFDGERVLRSIGDLYPARSEWKEIAEFITQDIVMKNLNVHWDDIQGLGDCKQRLKEIFVYPTKYPELWDPLFTPSKGILLYGPPGTGKTMLAKAVATECNFTFFNIAASSLVSKWRGDSEKYVRVLFELAIHHAPSVIFIDEIDWIAAGNEQCSSSNSEPARRFRAELLSRLDGLIPQNDSTVILLAATNSPWNLDGALLRRLENHIRVNVPDDETRAMIIETYRSSRISLSLKSPIVQKTRGYSGADLQRLCREAWIRMMRPVWEGLENGRKKENPAMGTYSALTATDEYLRSLEETCKYILCTAKYAKERYAQWEQDFSGFQIFDY